MCICHGFCGATPLFLRAPRGFDWRAQKLFFFGRGVSNKPGVPALDVNQHKQGGWRRSPHARRHTTPARHRWRVVLCGEPDNTHTHAHAGESAQRKGKWNRRQGGTARRRRAARPATAAAFASTSRGAAVGGAGGARALEVAQHLKALDQVVPAVTTERTRERGWAIKHGEPGGRALSPRSRRRRSSRQRSSRQRSSRGRTAR